MGAAAAPAEFGGSKAKGEHPKYFFTPAMDDEIRHAYHLHLDHNNRRAIGGCAKKLGVPRWLVTRRGGTLGLARVKERHGGAE